MQAVVSIERGGHDRRAPHEHQGHLAASGVPARLATGANSALFVQRVAQRLPADASDETLIEHTIFRAYNGKVWYWYNRN
jgi:hypothetical protein